jgi:hypothetical protein
MIRRSESILKGVLVVPDPVARWLMTQRNVTDLLGIVWKVWRVSPPPGKQHLLPESLHEGWLAFQSATERRRIGPVPEGWETLSEDALLTLLADSELFSVRPSEG